MTRTPTASITAPTTSLAAKFLFPLAVVTLPLGLGGLQLWALSIPTALLAVFLALETGRSQLSDRFLPKTGLEAPFLLYLVLFAAAAWWSLIPVQTAVEVFRLFAAAAFFLATCMVCSDRDRLYRFVTVLVWAGGFYATLGLFQYLGALPKGWWLERSFLSSVYENHNHFAGFLEICLPLSLALVVAEKDRGKKVLLVFLTLLMAVALVFTLSRGGYVAMAVGLLVMMAVLLRRVRARRDRWIYAGLLALVALAVTFFGTEPVVERVGSAGQIAGGGEMSFAQRWSIWKGTLLLIRDHWFLGSGPGTFEYVFLRYRPVDFTARAGFAHSDYLELVADCGLFALAAVLWIAAVIFARAWRAARNEESRLRTGVACAALASFIAYAIHSLIDFNFHIPANFIWMAVLAGLVVSSDSHRVYVEGAAKRAAVLALRTLSAVLLAASVWLGFSDFHFWTARAAMDEGLSVEVETSLDRSLAVRPSNPAAHFERGRMAIASDPDRAVKHLEEAAQLNRFEPYYSYHLGRAYISLGRFDQAHHSFAEAIAKDPNDPRLYFIAGRELLKLPQHEKQALEWLAEAVRRSPDVAEKTYQVLWARRRDISALEAFHRQAPAGLDGLLHFLEKRNLWEYHRTLFLQKPEVRHPRWNMEDFTWGTRSGDVFTLDDMTPASGARPNYGEFFFGNGELEKKVETRLSRGRLLLNAKGSPSGRAWPYLVIKMDGVPIDSVYVHSENYRNYAVPFEVPPGEHLISVAYVNDYARGGIDRNVWIRGIQLQASGTEVEKR